MMIVLRLGHRKVRDARVSTHCGLVARAFGADKIIYGGEDDELLRESIKRLTERWGGPFKVEYSPNWRAIIKKYRKKRFCIVHLSMYGISVKKKINELRKQRNILIIIGSEKVPGEVYQLSDFNVAVGNQPHSEVAALTVFLHEYFKGKQLDKKFKKAKIRIAPMERGKRVVEL